MTSDERKDLGPIDSKTWPSQLDGHAVSEAPEVRLFGYDVDGDLAANYRFSDAVYLAISGELPEDHISRAFEITLCFALPVGVAHAAVHAGALARLCGARVGGILSVSGIIFGEDATRLVDAGLKALADLDENATSRLHEDLRAAGVGERAGVARLSAQLKDLVEVRAFQADPSRDLAILAAFRACGLRSAFQLAAIVALARIPSALAEARCVIPGDFPSYPIDTPHFEYVEP